MATPSIVTVEWGSFVEPDLEVTVAMTGVPDSPVASFSVIDGGGSDGDGGTNPITPGVIDHTYGIGPIDGWIALFASINTIFDDGWQELRFIDGDHYVVVDSVSVGVTGLDVNITLGVASANFTPTDVSIDWGDGNTDDALDLATLTSTGYTHTYPNPGDFPVLITITDENGGTFKPQVQEAFRVFPVGDGIPVGTLSYSPSPVNQFASTDLSISGYSNGGLAIDAWEIQWGDGNVTDGAGDIEDGVLGSHTFMTAALFTTTVLVSTDSFATSSITVDTVEITVDAAGTGPPTGTISTVDGFVPTGEPITVFLDTFSVGGDTSITAVHVDWGDGVTDDGGGPPTAPSTIGSHAYTDPGVYTITYSVEDSDTTLHEIDSIIVEVFTDTTAPCTTFVLASASATVNFDCATPDDSPAGVVWIWNDIDGWWEPPAPDRKTLDGLGIPVESAPVQARWTPRAISLTATAILGGDQAALLDALATLTALCDMLRTPGSLTSVEAVPKTLPVRLGDRPTYQILGDALYLQVTIALIAHDPMRLLVSDATRVL